MLLNQRKVAVIFSADISKYTNRYAKLRISLIAMKTSHRPNEKWRHMFGSLGIKMMAGKISLATQVMQTTAKL